MTMFSLDDRVVTECVAAIRADGVAGGPRTGVGGGVPVGMGDSDAGVGDPADRSGEGDPTGGAGSVADVFARAAWCGIAEPGDEAAGVLLRSLGAPRSLEAVVQRESVGEIARQLAEVGETGLSLRQLGGAIERWAPRISANSVLASMRLAERCGARILVPGDPEWPVSVDDLGDHGPIALWVRGTARAVAAMTDSVALVGARAATGYGEFMATQLAAGLSDRGYTVVSGAAYGIDGMAHRVTLASSGLTVAFLAGGVDRFYPSGHDTLLSRIAEVGVVVSELPCGSPPTKWRFLQRNRLIAAVSRATVVVEAGARSGSLNTAAHAGSLGRPLGAVPGPVTSASSAGCHRLLREFDAVCVTNADEVLELFGGTGGTGETGGIGGPGGFRLVGGDEGGSRRRGSGNVGRSGSAAAPTDLKPADLEILEPASVHGELPEPTAAGRTHAESMHAESMHAESIHAESAHAERTHA